MMKQDGSMKLWFILFFFLGCLPALSFQLDKLGSSARSRKAVAKVTPLLTADLAKHHLRLGSPVFIRVFKQEKVLEVWLKKGPKYQLFRSYPICYFSGELGPKKAEGDLQVPEGFYQVTPALMNPWSQFHLSFNIGYPNRYDRQHRRTGSYIMIHGNCVSTGCLAMTDPKIEEIYTLVEAAFKTGQNRVPVHIFPFRMSLQTMQKHQNHPVKDFWDNLKQGYDHFETYQKPPQVSVRQKRYVFKVGN